MGYSFCRLNYLKIRSVHRLAICKKDYDSLKLPNTGRKSSTVLSLPIYAHMPFEDVNKVSDDIRKIHESLSED